MELTGNPFVDNGLCVMAHLSGCSSVEEMSWAGVKQLLGDGLGLARTNAQLKVFTMVFGTNGPLTQYAYKKTGKNQTIYAGTMQRLMAVAETEGAAGDPCELTGMSSTLNFHKVCAGALLEAGQDVPESKWIGRDWVPLAGSLGNDAQALPSASRPLHVSARALVALQFLPQSLSLFQGLLACYQSTHSPLVQQLVADLVEHNRTRLGGEILGKGEGSRFFVKLLLGLFARLHRTVEEQALPESTGLQLWLFSNSGTGADCRLVEIPDYALRTLWRATEEGFEGEIDNILNAESRDPRFQFLTALADRSDYRGLYAYSKWPGVSQRFYEFYQREVCERSPHALRSARTVAAKAIEKFDKKTLTVLRKPEAFHTGVNRSKLRRIIADELGPADYDALFPTIRRKPIAVHFIGWNLIRFYLNLSEIRDLKLSGSDPMRTTHPKIKILAEEYLKKGPVRVKSTLDRMARGKIGVAWLKEQFCEFAELRDGFTYQDWDELALDEEGRPVAHELLFQFRLELANLQRERVELERSTHV